MAEKISPDVLVQTATQLYFSVKKNRADLIEQSGSIEERRRQEVESFVTFYCPTQGGVKPPPLGGGFSVSFVVCGHEQLS